MGLKRANIIHFTPSYYSSDSMIGGGERFVNNMSRALSVTRAEAGIGQFNNTIFSVGNAPQKIQLAPEIQIIVEAGDPWDQRTLSAETIRAAALQADVVIVHQCLTGFGLFVASQAKLCGKTVLGVDHGAGEHPIVHHTTAFGKLFDCFLPYSSFGAIAFQRLNSRIEIIEGPVDEEYFTLGDGKRDPAHVISFGRVMPHKGFERVIRALPKNMRLTICGQKLNADYLVMLKDIARGRSVEIADAQNDANLRHLLQTAGVYVQASTHLDCYGHHYNKPELMGLAAAEALLCGLRVLVSSAGALPELTRNPGCRRFDNDEELAAMFGDLDRHSWPTERTIRDTAVATYGLRQYGSRLWQVFAELKQ